MDTEARQRFTEFVDERLMGLLRLGYLLTGDQHAAEDLVQAALTKTVVHWRRVRYPDAYVRQVMYREQASRWRRPRWHREQTTARPPERGVEDATGDVDLRLAMAQALLRLPPRKRAVLVLRYYEDLPDAEVAAVLGCSVGTVRSQAHRAVRQLRDLAPELAALSPPPGSDDGLRTRRAGQAAHASPRRPGVCGGAVR